MLATLSVSVPVLLTWTLVTALAALMFWFPNGILFGARTAAGAVPVPFRTPVCGLPGASSEILSVAVRAPVAPGVKVTLTMQDPVFAISTKFATHVVPAAIA